MDDAQNFKTCAMCRKEIDKGAAVCCFCGSGTNYQFFKEITYEDVTRNRPTVKPLVADLTTFAVAAVVGTYGFGTFGFWVGAGMAAVTYKVVIEIAKHLLGADGSDAVTIKCDHCHSAQNYTWPEGSLNVGTPAYFDCTNCKQRTALVSTPPSKPDFRMEIATTDTMPVSDDVSPDRDTLNR